jgi:hypothetical protein
MIQRTNKIFIGKDINRTSAIVDGQAVMTTATAGYGVATSTYVASGEILVLDKYKKVLGAGKTISDTDVIYICQGMGTSTTIANEAGTSVVVQHLRMSDPIEGKKVKVYNGESYVAKAEQTTVLDFTAPGAVVVDTEYIIRIIYRDIWEHPGQYTATYRLVATATSITTFIAAMAAKINAHSGRRVSAAVQNTYQILLTGLPIPQCTTGVNDLDPFTMVEFKTEVNYVNSSGYWTAIGLTANTVVEPVYGTGNWENVRDIERAAWGYLGITNRTHYPIIIPDVMTDPTKTYDIITIQHDASYVSPDNQYIKEAPLTTQIAFVVPSSGTQETTVLGVLNPWFASCLGLFAPVSV